MSGRQDRGARLRTELVEHLKEHRGLTDPRVEAAMLEVPRHLFLPGKELAEAYADEAVVTRYRDGLPVSSASQPAIVAVMLSQLSPRRGDAVLEIGAGTGYNAALLSALVGPAGRVVTVDIDPEVSAEARDHLSAAGVTNVEVICGDGAVGWPEGAPYDGIIVTAGASDLSPAWLSQLKPAGRIVVPLSIRAAQHCVAFARDGDHLRSVAICEAGFMPLTGAMANADVRVPVPGRPGVHVIAAPGTKIDSTVIAAGLDATSPAVPTGLTASASEAFGSLRRWLAFGDTASAVLMYSGPAEYAAKSGVPPLIDFRIGGNAQRMSPCLLGTSGFALLDVAPDELVVRTCGAAGQETRRLTELVKEWDAAGRPDTDRLLIDAYPSGTARPDDTAVPSAGSAYQAEHMTFIVSML